MKILVICQYYSPEPFRVADICEEFAKCGNDITVLTGLPNYPEGFVHKEYKHGKKRNEIINGVKIIRCFEIGRGKGSVRRILNYFSYAISAKRKAKKLPDDFDFVFVYQLSPVMMAWPAIAYKKKYNKKMVLYCLDLWPDSLIAGGIKRDSLIYKMFSKISNKIYRSADIIAVTSYMFMDYFTTKQLVSKDKLIYIPQYAEDIYKIDNIKRVEKDSFNFVFAGNIGEMQSVETIIKAAAQLKDHKNITFHIVGDGSKLEECKKIANGFTNIIFYGRRPIEEMPHFYEIADAMLVTLKSDDVISTTLPGKIQSYMAAGKPIIAAANGETEFVINKAKCGYCCKAEDYVELSRSICNFISEDHAVDLGLKSRQYYDSCFSKEKVFDQIKSLLNMEVN